MYSIAKLEFALERLPFFMIDEILIYKA